MEYSDIILTLVGILAAGTGGVVKSVVGDIKSIEKQAVLLRNNHLFSLIQPY